MTSQQAIALAKTKFWESMTLKECALFQLEERIVCMPLEVFHDAVEKTLQRKVHVSEFRNPDRLKEEILGNVPPPTLQDYEKLFSWGDERS